MGAQLVHAARRPKQLPLRPHSQRHPHHGHQILPQVHLLVPRQDLKRHGLLEIRYENGGVRGVAPGDDTTAAHEPRYVASLAPHGQVSHPNSPLHQQPHPLPLPHRLRHNERLYAARHGRQGEIISQDHEYGGVLREWTGAGVGGR